MCRSRRELSNAYFLAKFRFDTAENEPCKVCRIPVPKKGTAQERVSEPVEGTAAAGRSAASSSEGSTAAVAWLHCCRNLRHGSQLPSGFAFGSRTEFRTACRHRWQRMKFWTVYLNTSICGSRERGRFSGYLLVIGPIASGANVPY